MKIIIIFRYSNITEVKAAVLLPEFCCIQVALEQSLKDGLQFKAVNDSVRTTVAVKQLVQSIRFISRNRVTRFLTWLHLVILVNMLI